MQPHDLHAFKIRISLIEFAENGCMQQGNKLKQETNSTITKITPKPLHATITHLKNKLNSWRKIEQLKPVIVLEIVTMDV